MKRPNLLLLAGLTLLAVVGCQPEPAPDTTPPTIVATDPADGARGVRKNVVLRVHFSEAMDPACTEAAYDSSSVGLRPSEVTLSWDDELTLVITPNDRLAYSNDENDKVYAFTIHETACDLAKNPMTAQKTVRFYVLRKLSGTLLSEAALDGYVFNTGRVETQGHDLGTGDGPHEEYAHAFVSFDLSQLNPDPVEVVSAHLVLTKELVTGNPSQGLGRLIVEHVHFGSSLGTASLELEALPPDPVCAFPDLSRTVFGCWKGVAVQDDVDHWLERDGRSQFRIRFARNSDGNGAQDSIMFYSGDSSSHPPALYLVYYGP